MIAQYARFLWNAVQGDFGCSFRGQKPVLRSIMTRFPHTLELTHSALVLAICCGIPAGMLAARDYPEIQGAVLITATVYVILNLAVDLLYGYIDQLIRYT